MRMTLSTRFMLDLFDRLEALGLPQKRAFHIANMIPEDCENLLARVPLERMAAVFNHAAQVLKDPYIGLNVGFKFRISAYSQTGIIYSYCQNMPQVILTNAKYQQLAIDAGDITYDQELDEHTRQIRHFMTFRPLMRDMKTYRHVIDSIAASYCTTYNWLIWSSGQGILQVDFPYDEPTDLFAYHRLFKCRLRFNQPYLRIEFSEKTMYHEIATYDAEKFARAEAKLMGLLKGSELCDKLKVAIKTAMHAALKNGSVSTHIIADRMETTWAALRKDMEEAGLSYRYLLEDVRREIFHASLSEDKTFSIIAQDLGYNDQAAFTKAFKRWYGVSPRQWKSAYLLGQTLQPNYKSLT